MQNSVNEAPLGTYTFHICYVPSANTVSNDLPSQVSASYVQEEGSFVVLKDVSHATVLAVRSDIVHAVVNWGVVE